MTAAQFLARTDGPSHEELLDGELHAQTPNFEHQQVLASLAVDLKNWIGAGSGRGTVTLAIDTWFDEYTVLGPDLQWYADGRDLPDPTTRPYPPGDIVVEVRSPSTWGRDVVLKRAKYERHGVRELWLVDTVARSVLVLRRSKADQPEFDLAVELRGDEPLVSPLLGGFAAPVGALFDD
jgi:Uma2 family endonuclease